MSFSSLGSNPIGSDRNSISFIKLDESENDSNLEKITEDVFNQIQPLFLKFFKCEEGEKITEENFKKIEKENITPIVERLLKEHSFNEIFIVSNKIIKIAEELGRSEKSIQKKISVKFGSLAYKYRVFALISQNELEKALKALSEIRDLEIKQEAFLFTIKNLHQLEHFNQAKEIIKNTFTVQKSHSDKLSHSLSLDRDAWLGELAIALFENNFINDAGKTLGELSNEGMKNYYQKKIKEPSFLSRLMPWIKG